MTISPVLYATLVIFDSIEDCTNNGSHEGRDSQLPKIKILIQAVCFKTANKLFQCNWHMSMLSLRYYFEGKIEIRQENA